MIWSGAMLLGLLVGGATAADVGEGPKPASVPRAWEFQLDFLDPRRIEMQGPGDAKPVVYWYMVYTVTNRSRTSERFFPRFQIVTDDLRVIETDMGINLAVFDAIAERHKTTHKYLVPPTKAIGSLLSGDDNARESVAIWRDVELTENRFSIFVGGLSGEALTVPNPALRAGGAAPGGHAQTADNPSAATPSDPNAPAFFTLRKTLEIPYTLPGSETARAAAMPQRGETRWVMR